MKDDWKHQFITCVPVMWRCDRLSRLMIVED